jgi:hypothetical protein
MAERNIALRVALIAGSFAASGAPADEPDDRRFHVQIGQRLSEETNLYRLPEGIDPADFIAGARRDDDVASSSLSVAGLWERGRQAVELDTSVATNRFSRNTDLDNDSGRGSLAWRWQLGKWSTQLGGHREQALASFANTYSFEKDVLDVAAKHGEARFDATPRWRATFAARESATEHSNPLRVGENTTTRSAIFGLLHHTPRADTIGVELRRARAEHPERALGTLPAASDYDERRALVTLRYLLASKLQFDGNAGRVERSYPYGARGAFDGDIWNAELRWVLSPKTAIALERWQDVKANLDAESEHFVATGGSLTARWSPIDTVRIAVQTSRERQRYIGRTDGEIAEGPRYDNPHTDSFTLTYAPRQRFSLDLSYWREARDSNRARFDYAAESLAVAWQLTF